MSEHLEGKASAILTVARGMQVLGAFRSDRAPVTNAELVRRTGLSKAVVSRLTSTMVELGFLKHVARGFELGTATLGFGHAFVAGCELLQTANPFMQQLADRLNVTVGLAIGQDLDMLFIGYRASQKVATLRLGVGSVLPMGESAVGHAYLWALPIPEQTELITRLKRNAGSHAIELENNIRKSFADLENAEPCGVLSCLRGTYGIAVPVRVGRQQVRMSLVCGRALLQPDLAAERKRIAPILKEAAVEFQQLVAEMDGRP
jgi:DNA-binding IclR family transcriptional regulator